MTKITASIQQRVAAIIEEQNYVIKERAEVIHGLWTATVGQLHVLLDGPGGTGKSMLIRDLTSHIEDSIYFEIAVDETTDPGQVFGPPDIKAMVELGKTRRVTTGMFSECTHAFIDEIFNANSPVLHSLMPGMNERLFHNNGVPVNIPLRSLIGGTNKVIDNDPDLAAFYDRLHLRYPVAYVQQRDSQADMVAQAIARMTILGRGTSTSIATQVTTVTLAEMDLAHKEALALDIDDVVMNVFLDLKEELRGNGIVISDRRMVEGMAAVLSNAWVRGHESVQIADLDILTSMWWSLKEQAPTARGVILAVCNPGEKAALDLLDELDKLHGELSGAANMDPERKKRLGVEVVRNTEKLIREANDHLAKAKASGANTQRLDEAIQRADLLKIKVGEEVFGINPEDLGRMQK